MPGLGGYGNSCRGWPRQLLGRPVSRRPGRRLPLEAGMGPQVVIALLSEPEFDPRMTDIHEQGFVQARVG